MACLSILDSDAVRPAPASREPCSGLLGGAAVTGPGDLTADEVTLNDRLEAPVDELESDAFSPMLGDSFGVDLVPCPRLTTIMTRSQLEYGAIRAHGPSKVGALPVSMDDAWMDDVWEAPAAGRRRVRFGGRNDTPVAVAAPPTMGTMFAYPQRDPSRHGHESFEGERPVVQAAWMTDAAEPLRERNRTARFSKGLFGR